jgi:hypothetical protein
MGRGYGPKKASADDGKFSIVVGNNQEQARTKIPAMTKLRGLLLTRARRPPGKNDEARAPPLLDRGFRLLRVRFLGNISSSSLMTGRSMGIQSSTRPAPP